MPMPKGWKRLDITKEWLHQKYIVEELSIPDLSSLCGYSRTHVRRLLKESGIKIRTKAEGVKTPFSRQKRHGSMTGKMAGSLTPSYKRGYWETNGYLFTKIRGKNRQIHRMTAEKMIGRPLNQNEVVHHKNGITTDNRPENLQVMNRSDHIRMHSKERWQRRENK